MNQYRPIFKTINTLLLIVFSSASSQAQKATDFFPAKDLMRIGSYYYPEQWPRSVWERDIKKMADLGFEFTHFGEFAWTFIEPKDGQFDFKWLDEAVDLAYRNGLRVIMCTSTPTPPAWLTQKHPEVLMVNAEGRTIQHGARQHCSWSSPVYRRYVARMVEALARHYANDNRIWGWQLDNEPSHYGQTDYSAAAQESFRRWLQKKYRSIDSLNTSWGTAFWSLRYDNFGQVRIPNQRELAQQANPHAVLDFRRFCADEANDFLRFQYTILRKHIPDGQWITTNLMPEHAEVDPTRIKGLDFLTYTKYLVAGNDRGVGAQGFRVGSATGIAYANDLFRSFNGVTGIIELQPGQVNWGRFNAQPMPGAVRLWIWHAFAGGNKFVCNYRFDRALTGGEQYHYAIMEPDGVTVSTSGAEYLKVIDELKSLKSQYNASAQIPTAYKKRYAGLLYNADNRWEMDNQAQTFQWSSNAHLKRYYNALKSFGAPVDVITEDKDFSAYAVLVAPAYQLLDAQLVERWKAYVQNSGHLVLSCRTAQKDRTGKLWQAPLAGPIHNLIGAKVSFFDHLPETGTGTIGFGDKSFVWNNWADVLEPAASTDVWATYTNQFYVAQACVTHRKLGKGTVTYVGADTDDGLLEKAVLAKVYEQAGIAVENYPEGVMVDWRDGFWVGVNYGNKPFEAPVKSKAIIGDKTLQPVDVVVWKE